MKKYLIFVLFLIILIINNNSKATKIEILAKVNNEIITNIDLEYRLNLALEISKIPNETKFRKQVRKQMLNLLIDETLKIQEANRYGILISSSEVYSEISRIEQKLKMPKDSLIKDFKEKNIPEIVIYNQVRGELLWNKIISYRIANNISISNKQKEDTLQNFIKNSGEVEYNISEIFISSDSQNAMASAEEKMLSIFKRANNSNFTALAQQFSDGALNIDSWVRESALNPEAKKIIEELNVGDISKPAQNSSGLRIYLLNDKRKTKKIIQNDILYNLSQIFFNTSQVDKIEIQNIKNKLLNLRENIENCSQLEAYVKKDIKSSGGSLGVLSAQSLDKRFLEVLENNLEVGKLSQAIITEDGIHSIMLCEQKKTVDLDSIKKNIEQNLRLEKINNAANLLLNDIRQRALIEINVM